MDKFKAVIIREPSSLKQTLGELTLYKNEQKIFSCKTLELPWKNNTKQESCIPTGKYNVIPRESAKYKKHYHVQDVTGRSWILIHPGNYYHQLLGCILVGNAHVDIDKDGYKDVTSARITLDKLLELAPNGFELVIK
jgi:hypothetical protein